MLFNSPEFIIFFISVLVVITVLRYRKFQHLLRVDREFSNFKISKKLIENIESAILKNIKQTDLIILSDYNKGLISKLLIILSSKIYSVNT